MNDIFKRPIWSVSNRQREALDASVWRDSTDMTGTQWVCPWTAWQLGHACYVDEV